MKIDEYVDIKQYSSLKVGGQFQYFAVIDKIADLIEALSFAKEKDVKIFILGGGSNIVFRDGAINALALKIEIKGFEVVSEGDNYTDIKVGAGENWDQTVSKAVSMGLSGLESLSAIPGTVGASPVQNIGAYGSEVKDTIKEVEVYEIETGEIFNISNKDCKFGYRDSIFKNEAKGKYVIMGVIYRLLKETTDGIVSRGHTPTALSYPGVMKYFDGKKIENPSLEQTREAIIDIRREKLPNPIEVPNVGSFFKNPIVLSVVADKILNEFSNAKFFELEDGLTKIPAGWLIENAGLKGKSFGSVSIYDKNALVLVNNGNATSEDIFRARDEIMRIVKEKFGIALEQEPEYLK